MSKTFLLVATGALIAALSQTADAGTPPRKRNGDHPAVVVQRLKATQGYDYAAKFYPHPAWLYLRGALPQAELDAGVTPAAPADPADAPDAGTALARTDVE